MRTIVAIGLSWLALSLLLAWAWHRFRTYEKCRVDQMQFAIDDLDAENGPPERDFAAERSKLEAQREDAAEAQHELARDRVEEVIRELKERCR